MPLCFLNVDGLDESLMSASSICGLEVGTRRDAAIPFGTYWDYSPYFDFAQTWLEDDIYSAGYGREKNSTLATTSQPFSDAMNESSSTLFPCQGPFSAEPYTPAMFGDDSWGAFLSPDLTSFVDDTSSSPMSAQETGKENIPPLRNSPTLNDFAGLSSPTSVWADSLSAKFATHSADIPGLSHSPDSMRLRPVGQRKGLLGWGGTSDLHSLPPRPKSPSYSPGADAGLDPHILTLDASSPLRKRRRQSILSNESTGMKSESLSLDSTDSESDGYRPSCSPSPKFKRFKIKPEPSSEPSLSPKPAFRSLKRVRTNSRKKEKKKGSAALALAVVTQIGEAKREAQTLQLSLDPESLDPVRVYHEGSYVVKKRKNQPIPVPVPVPNLNKKSRGRKVPFVSDCESPVPAPADAPSIEYNRGGLNQTSRKQVRTVSASDDSGASRSYVCVVPGCGKCFVRGEHLKRHVRCIHTNDKPHVCPIEGCDKSFSRRDNLGQHVRVHLQP